MDLTRRKFLTGAVLSVTAALVPSIIMAEVGGTFPEVPSEAECLRWLEAYKVRCDVVGKLANAARIMDLHEYDGIDGIVGYGRDGAPEKILTILPDGTCDAFTQRWLLRQKEFFEKWNDFGRIRQRIAIANGLGYNDGRDGSARRELTYAPGSDEHFAYHNYYYVGAADRKRFG